MNILDDFREMLASKQTNTTSNLIKPIYPYGYGGGWMYLYSFICLSAIAVDWKFTCFATTLLHHAPRKVTSVIVLFVIFYFT